MYKPYANLINNFERIQILQVGKITNNTPSFGNLKIGPFTMRYLGKIAGKSSAALDILDKSTKSLQKATDNRNFRLKGYYDSLLLPRKASKFVPGIYSFELIADGKRIAEHDISNLALENIGPKFLLADMFDGLEKQAKEYTDNTLSPKDAANKFKKIARRIWYKK